MCRRASNNVQHRIYLEEDFPDIVWIILNVEFRSFAASCAIRAPIIFVIYTAFVFAYLVTTLHSFIEERLQYNIGVLLTIHIYSHNTVLSIHT